MTISSAYICGVGRFQDNTIPEIENITANINGVVNLVNDKKLFTHVLSEDVRVSINEDKKNILRKFTDFSRTRKYNETVLFYFSGHGVIGTKDFNVYMPAVDSFESYIETEGISITRIREIIKSCRSKRKIVILDFCYSGSIHGAMNVNSNGAVLTAIDKIKGAYIMTSATASTPSFYDVDNPSRPSYFTEALIKILTFGLNSEQEYITTDKLFESLCDELLKIEDRVIIPQKSLFDNADKILVCKNKLYAIESSLKNETQIIDNVNNKVQIERSERLISYSQNAETNVDSEILAYSVFEKYRKISIVISLSVLVLFTYLLIENYFDKNLSDVSNMESFKNNIPKTIGSPLEEDDEFNHGYHEFSRYTSLKFDKYSNQGSYEYLSEYRTDLFKISQAEFGRKWTSVVKDDSGDYFMVGTVTNSSDDVKAIRIDQEMNVVWKKDIGGGYADYNITFVITEEAILLANSSSSHNGVRRQFALEFLRLNKDNGKIISSQYNEDKDGNYTVLDFYLNDNILYLVCNIKYQHDYVNKYWEFYDSKVIILKLKIDEFRISEIPFPYSSATTNLKALNSVKYDNKIQIITTRFFSNDNIDDSKRRIVHEYDLNNGVFIGEPLKFVVPDSIRTGVGFVEDINRANVYHQVKGRKYCKVYIDNIDADCMDIMGIPDDTYFDPSSVYLIDETIIFWDGGDDYTVKM